MHAKCGPHTGIPVAGNKFSPTQKHSKYISIHSHSLKELFPFFLNAAAPLSMSACGQCLAKQLHDTVTPPMGSVIPQSDFLRQGE